MYSVPRSKHREALGDGNRTGNQPSKLAAGVRLPSPAPWHNHRARSNLAGGHFVYGGRFPPLRLTLLLLITLVLSAAASTVDWLINLLETRHVIPLIVGVAAALIIFLTTVATANWWAAKLCFTFRGVPRWHTSQWRSLGPMVIGGILVFVGAAAIAHLTMPPGNQAALSIAKILILVVLCVCCFGALTVTDVAMVLAITGLGTNTWHCFASAVQWLRSRPWPLFLTSAALIAFEELASLAVSALSKAAVADFLRDTLLLAYGPLWVWCFSWVAGEARASSLEER
ncbi:hypothetical protein Aaci_2539 [Alicyclobacillus acidocaldarius subsp. acidocaldarius DSM 446]|uniref:Uncharacterized protein n=1 Tax=Alicyclobacillus acidocaldarius subsp. acidocaldarius (strain ATCC 27009 / DSM 446 / BCRC 14685 / JCM 5260 / KCTC 1825 / NBRC 15652 / NCIMB 11725 / NRRL B-14509 / 104-IA) TaxID=521098 RepID=C8WT29_ALIAD|nr:hypothetical protein Aaci_2539 [Alicyclobacillus acidocaldarius subsp. acidocaldarius DSM 446]